jgi:uncharacterized YigZ family protein
METYRTLKTSVESPVYKVKGSKFIGFAYPVASREEIETVLDDLRANHAKANHLCYGWKLGKERIESRFNDDGEPTNSAGKPIYGQILSHDLTDVLLVVVRYFGGTKLGVGGLIQAYREAARMAIDEGKVMTRQIKLSFVIEFEYPQMDKVMRLIKENQVEIVVQDMAMRVRLEVMVRKNKEVNFRQSLSRLHEVRLIEPDDHA